MKILKAKNPVNFGRFGPDQELISNTVHKVLSVQTLQNDGTQSKLNITINEDYRDVIWLGIEVDNKYHRIEHHLDELINEIKQLSK